MKKDNYTVIDLFAGCGGLSEGFKQTKEYNFKAFVEWEKKPCETLIHRLKNKWNYKKAEDIVLRFDLQRTDELINGWENDPEYGTHIGLDKLITNDLDIVIGGPPCQAYSLAGRVQDKNGMKDDYRNYLFESYVKVVNKYKPKLFVFENVPGILSAKPGDILIIDRIKKAFNDIGYEISNDLKTKAMIDASDYGIPQIRKRVIIIGVNKSLVNNSQEILDDFYLNVLPSFKVKEKNTIRNAISDLTPIYPLNDLSNKKISHYINCDKFCSHSPRFHSKRDQEIFIELANDKLSGTNKYSDTKSLIQLYYERTGKKSKFHKYNVLEYDKPSNTIPAHLYKDGLRHIHPDPKQARSITPREAARIQTFPDDFEFKGTMGDKYKMIGNAVPPLLSKNIAKAILKVLNNYF
ncbi:DNA cytosine methyltransferase [Aliarcobacter butzleri]|uniref:DNA cytosine methyltransferase n=1 Tax=Aliarcobacter butzleri TaxID=28197 RepID=UPI001EDAD65A|nr:DNA cytosine methyltransferase [Aliarcobacter butzleri]MCG3671721.1 DNA cytosine methyltransferase [Aliarcobacter butzleri]